VSDAVRIQQRFEELSVVAGASVVRQDRHGMAAPLKLARKQAELSLCPARTEVVGKQH